MRTYSIAGTKKAVDIDVSDYACEEFTGLKHGDVIINPVTRNVRRVVGVQKAVDGVIGPPLMWYEDYVDDEWVMGGDCCQSLTPFSPYDWMLKKNHDEHYERHCGPTFTRQEIIDSFRSKRFHVYWNTYSSGVIISHASSKKQLRCLMSRMSGKYEGVLRSFLWRSDCSAVLSTSIDAYLRNHRRSRVSRNLYHGWRTNISELEKCRRSSYFVGPRHVIDLWPVGRVERAGKKPRADLVVFGAGNGCLLLVPIDHERQTIPLQKAL